MAHRQHKFTDEQLSELSNGCNSIAELSRKLSISKSGLYALCRRNNIVLNVKRKIYYNKKDIMSSILEHSKTAKTYSEIAKKLNIKYGSLIRLCKRTGIRIEKNKLTKETIEAALTSSKTLAEAAKKCNTDSGYLSKLAKGFGLNPRIAKRHGVYKPRINLDEVLCGKHPTYSSTRLKKRLIREGILKRECVTCKGTTWLGNEIPLQLDHINGNPTDNRLDNLRLLCPNCHTLTPTYCGKNVNASRKR